MPLKDFARDSIYTKAWISIKFTFPAFELLYIMDNRNYEQDLPDLFIPEYLGMK